jgi:hypothetical protein
MLDNPPLDNDSSEQMLLNRLGPFLEHLDALAANSFQESSFSWMAHFSAYALPKLAGNKRPGGDKKAPYRASYEALRKRYSHMSECTRKSQIYPFVLEDDYTLAYWSERKQYTYDKLVVDRLMRESVSHEGESLENSAVISQIKKAKIEIQNRMSEGSKHLIYINFEELLKSELGIKGVQQLLEKYPGSQIILISSKAYTTNPYQDIEDDDTRALLAGLTIIYTNRMLQMVDVMDHMLSDLQGLPEIESVKIFGDENDLRFSQTYGFAMYEHPDSVKFAELRQEDLFKRLSYFSLDGYEPPTEDVCKVWIEIFLSFAVKLYSESLHCPEKTFYKEGVRVQGKRQLDLQDELASYVGVPSLRVREQIEVLFHSLEEKIESMPDNGKQIKVIASDFDNTVCLGQYSNGGYIFNGGSAADWGRLFDFLGAPHFVLTSRDVGLPDYAGFDYFSPILEKTGALPSVFLGCSCSKAYFLELLIAKLERRFPDRDIRVLLLEDSDLEVEAHREVGKPFDLIQVRQYPPSAKHPFSTLPFCRDILKYFGRDTYLNPACPYPPRFLYGLPIEDTLLGDIYEGVAPNC